MLRNNKIKNRKLNSSILAIIILILILICVFVLFFEINNYRKIKEEKYQFYHYFAHTKIQFDGTITLNSEDKVLSIKKDNITLSSKPVYYVDYSDKLILPKDMEIVFPYKANPMYRVGNYSRIYYNGSYLYINSEAGFGRLHDCFFYDGENTYVFAEDTTVFVDGTRYELNPLSYIAVNGSSIEIYDRESDVYTNISDVSEKVMAYTSEYAINLTDDTFTYKNNYYLLIRRIDGLSLYEF